MADFKADPSRVSGKLVVVLFVAALVLFGAFIMWKRSVVRTKLAADADAAAAKGAAKESAPGRAQPATRDGGP